MGPRAVKNAQSPVRTLLAAALAAGLLGLFFRHVDLARVVVEIRRTRPAWLLLALTTMLFNLVIRSVRWQFLLEPLVRATFANSFRATAVGFAASSVLPARAGEVIRPYFLSLHEPISAAGAFATIVLERLLDTVTVLIQLAVFVLFFGRQARQLDPVLFRAVQWMGASAGIVAAGALSLLFVLAGRPARLARVAARFEQLLPAARLAVVARIVDRFTAGLGVVRRPSRLLAALALSFPLWLSIALGIWAVTRAFRLAVPFNGALLLLAFIVLGVAVPTPAGIGGFHEAFRLSATTFYGVPEPDAVAAALVLHALSIGPALLLGLYFAAAAGLNLTGMHKMARENAA